MATVLFGILILFEVASCAPEYSFDGVIRHFAVGNGKVFVATESRLYQMSNQLVKEKDKVISSSTHLNAVNILLPFEVNRTLITCGTDNCGYCEVLNISDITQTIYREEKLPVGPHEDESSVAFLVSYSSSSDGSYMLVAREDENKIKKDPECAGDAGVILRNTLHTQTGDIFSKLGTSTDANIQIHDVKWVDGFQTSSHSYLFANSVSKVYLLKMENKSKKDEMIKSLKVAILHCCNGQQHHELVSSTFMVSDSSVLWMGIFTQLRPDNPENTVLAIYNITAVSILLQSNIKIPQQFTCLPSCGNSQTDTKPSPIVDPIAVVFKHNSMTSVAAKKKGSWTALYIGTANGQLIKLVLDTKFRSGCAKVLYRSDDDRTVFPRMYFDPVDENYIYIALTNQIKRVLVSQCDTYGNLKDCIGSMDPFCGWCGQTDRCCTQEKCQTSPWLSTSKNSLQKELISFQVVSPSPGQISLTSRLRLDATGDFPFSCTFKAGDMDMCNKSSQVAVFPKCTCHFPESLLLSNGRKVAVTFNVSNQIIKEDLTLRRCPHIPDAQCATCVSAGCYWDNSVRNCTWASESTPDVNIQDMCNESSSESYMPEILSMWPNKVSFHGKKNVEIKGKNLEQVKKIRFRGFMGCNLNETSVLKRFNDTIKFHIPSGNKGTVTVCLVTVDGRCHGNATVTYGSQPTCKELHPNVSWFSGDRTIKVSGSNLEYVDTISMSAKEIVLRSENKIFSFNTPGQKEFGPFNVSLQVGDSAVTCKHELSYQPDPEFTNFTTSKVGNILQVTIQKKEDQLNLTNQDLKVWGLQEQKRFECTIEKIESSVVICKISGNNDGKISVDALDIYFGNGNKSVKTVQDPKLYAYALVTLIILILLGAIAGVFIHRKSQRRMNAQMNEHLELLENEIRQEIRQGFVDLQTDSSDLVENVGAIPYLDYKHFALKIFFPEGGPLANQMIKETAQDAVMDEKCQAFSNLIRDQTFLTCFVHALEEQKSFSLKDKCTVASLLTVTLHSDLPYLTQLMEELLQNLMDQPSNTQPKLLLRRTESIVEKLLTNWMSICLYGFLRESVGQPLFLMVSALNQQISKGPVDAVTEKALYTLNEDWLLWQAQGFNFSLLKLKVHFAVGTEGEVSEPLDVNVLTCDTIDQVKDKILQTFQRKFGFRYTQQLRDIGIEYMKEGSYIPLEEIDGSSEVQGEVTMLNTLKHYNIPDGASIKVITKKVHAPLSPQTSLKDDQNFTTKYFHLIDPDIDMDQSEHPERKKLKLKEIYLTKLLSTKVAVHSFVENLFKSIWGMPNNKAPTAVKYFFDFLDSQAEKKKIMDPDVIHIWKTNSLPLRFWVNILKNPNFVFSDLEKTPHLDGCLSVIAQAFMDSFSLTDHQLGKHAPTNKLLYAKDIPKYKQDVKMYYKLLRDQPSISSQDFKVFLEEESKKHENEFNEPAALRMLYKYMKQYSNKIEQQLELKEAPSRLKEEMARVTDLFESVNRSAWI